MEFFEKWGMLLLGLMLLVASGEFLIRGSVAIAKHFKLRPMVVGMTIVAFGTSAPELIVSLNAAISGHPEIALGNVIGSNIANIALVLGLTASIIALPVKSSHLMREWAIMLVVSIAFILFLSNNTISRVEGAILFAVLIAFIIFSIKKGDSTEQVPDAQQQNLWISAGFIIASSVGLAYGADLLVKGASNIATGWGVSERVISITIVAFGTSLPELMTSVISALRKQTDISIGNIIGSNLFNILAVIGLTSIIHPIQATFSNFVFDFGWMIGFAILLIILVQPLKHKIAGLTRWGGLSLLALYLAYVISLFY